MDRKTIIMFGAGYTLNHTASLLKDYIIIKVARSSGDFQGDLKNKNFIKEVLKSVIEPFIVIDSVPPDYTAEDPLLANRNIVAAIKNYQVSTAIYLSSTAVYGQDNGDEVTEDSPLNPQNIRGNLRLEAERLYKDQNYPSIILRLSGIYGPGRGVAMMMRRGEYNPLNIDRYTNRIHVEDIALVIARLIKNPPPGLNNYEIINVSDDLPAQVGEVWHYYKKRFNLPEPNNPPTPSKSGRDQQNQCVSNVKLKSLLAPDRLKFPTYKDGAGSEF